MTSMASVIDTPVIRSENEKKYPVHASLAGDDDGPFNLTHCFRYWGVCSAVCKSIGHNVIAITSYISSLAV